MLYVPEMFPKTSPPPNNNNPPIPVIPKAVNADFLEASLVLLKPIKKKELILVNSQNTNKEIRLSDNTKPNIAPIKILR